jgi:hypothetical protein
VTRRTELTLIGHLRDDRGRRDRTHARDGGEPSAGLVVPVPGDDGRHCHVNFVGLTRSGVREYRTDHATYWTHVSRRHILKAFKRIS